jgi:hypothetical protein
LEVPHLEVGRATQLQIQALRKKDGAHDKTITR